MLVWDVIAEAKVPSVRDQIIADVAKHGGSADQYFVRFKSIDQRVFNLYLRCERTDAKYPGCSKE